MVLSLFVGVSFLLLSLLSGVAGLAQSHSDIYHTSGSDAGDHDHHTTPDKDGQPHHCHGFCFSHGASALPVETFCFNSVASTFRIVTIIHDSVPDGPVQSIDYPPQLS